MASLPLPDSPPQAALAERAQAPPGLYRGRFAPSPTGPLHAGSLVAAVASWLDARAHGGTWLLRIEDVDTPRCVPGAAAVLQAQLAALGLHPDEPPWWQSRRDGAYAQALQALQARGQAYACGCTRRDIEAALHRRGVTSVPHAERVYPGTCRDGLHGKPARAVRLRVPEGTVVHWHDRCLGAQTQAVDQAVGDFVLHRADGLWAYQLAVVVDDAAQGITHVVRGEDLADNTPRQILLQRALGLPTPAYLHTPLVRGPDGRKLSKQHGAPAVDPGVPALRAALAVLGLDEAADAQHQRPDTLLADAVPRWRARHGGP